MQQPAMSILEFFSSKEFCVPLWEVSTLIVINSLCLLLGKHKLGLIVTYLFVFYWGFIINSEYFVDALGHMTVGVYVYAAVGVTMAAVAIIAFFVRGGD